MEYGLKRISPYHTEVLYVVFGSSKDHGLSRGFDHVAEEVEEGGQSVLMSYLEERQLEHEQLSVIENAPRGQ